MKMAAAYRAVSEYNTRQEVCHEEAVFGLHPLDLRKTAPQGVARSPITALSRRYLDASTAHLPSSAFGQM